MACEARAARGSLIYILEMISLRIEPRNLEDYLYIDISYILYLENHYIVTIQIINNEELKFFELYKGGILNGKNFRRYFKNF